MPPNSIDPFGIAGNNRHATSPLKSYLEAIWKQSPVRQQGVYYGRLLRQTALAS